MISYCFCEQSAGSRSFTPRGLNVSLFCVRLVWFEPWKTPSRLRCYRSVTQRSDLENPASFSNGCNGCARREASRIGSLGGTQSFFFFFVDVLMGNHHHWPIYWLYRLLSTKLPGVVSEVMANWGFHRACGLLMAL